MSRGIKKRRPDINVIWGGVHPSLFPEQTVSDNAIDTEGFHCNFCINVILKKKYKMRSAEEIVERIKFLQKEYGANYIHLNDENFFGSKKRTYQFVELILSNNIRIKWRPSVRANYLKKEFYRLNFEHKLMRLCKR